MCVRVQTWYMCEGQGQQQEHQVSPSSMWISDSKVRRLGTSAQMEVILTQTTMVFLHVYILI